MAPKPERKSLPTSRGLLVPITTVSVWADAAPERLGLGLAPPVLLAVVVHGAEGDPFRAEVRAGADDSAACSMSSFSGAQHQIEKRECN